MLINYVIARNIPDGFCVPSGRVAVTLTQDLHKINGILSKVQPMGNINFETAIRVAHVSKNNYLF